MRSAAAASKRAAREAQRRQRAQDKQYQQARRQQQRAVQQQYKSLQQSMGAMAKQQALADAKLQADAFAARVEVLRSVHGDCSTPVHWPSLVASGPPPAPVMDGRGVHAAMAALQAYQPSFFDASFGGAAQHRAQLEAHVRAAEQHAHAQYAHAHAAWQHACALLQWQQRVGQGVLRGDLDAYRTVVEYWDVFDELEDLGSTVELQHLAATEAEVDLYVNSDEVIPTESLSLLASGKLSTKAMPNGQRNALYQDYVCGSALRIARELFAVLPLQRVLVHAVAEMLDTATGHVEPQPVLSVLFVRATFDRLNFVALDASDAMKLFVHKMKFSKSNGFAPVEPLDRSALPPA